MIKVAFVCVHNSCRSQIAEALAKKYGDGIIEVYSAGTEIKDKINKDAVRLMKDIYDINIELTQKPKVIFDIPNVDYLVTMGCNVKCPYLPYKYMKIDFDIEDPTGKDDDEFIKIIKVIENKIIKFIDEIKNM